MSLSIYSSLSRVKAEFKPQMPGKVSMYVCGITPYDTTHLGHAFTYVVFDLKSIQVERGDSFLLVPVSPTSGLPTPDSTNPNRLPRALSDAEMKDDHLTLKRSFEPIEGEVE